MNKFDEKYKIRLATHNDIGAIMAFIDKYWAKGHIMSVDRELFEYEYVYENGVNFILAIDRHTACIEGIFGFIRCSHTNDDTKRDIWGSMWMTVKDHDNMPLLGIELAKRIHTFLNIRTHIGNGANPKTTIPLRKIFFGDKTVKMKQYYLLNSEIDNYKIAVVKNKTCNLPAKSGVNGVLKQFFSIDEVKKEFDIESLNAIPYKDNWYFNKRYFCHPYYRYNVYGVKASEQQEVKALLAARVVECCQSRVLRIVDYLGEQSVFGSLAFEFERLIKENCCEYIDFYTHGFNEKFILQCGFKLRTEDDCNIIPNYFEPFLRENVEIYAHYKLDKTLFFKADGDQDRPNIAKTNCNVHKIAAERNSL